MKNTLNTDVKTRDKLIFGKYEPKKYSGGIRRFEGMTPYTLSSLLHLKFIDPECTQNYSPTVAVFHDFICKYPEYTVHGYAVELERNDYRVSIEGVEKPEGYGSAEELEEFTLLFRKADEFHVGSDFMRCWFD